MIPTLEEFAKQEPQARELPIEKWLKEHVDRNLYQQVVSYLKSHPRPVSTVHEYLVKYHGYEVMWLTEKPIRELMNKVKRGNPVTA